LAVFGVRSKWDIGTVSIEPTGCSRTRLVVDVAVKSPGTESDRAMVTGGEPVVDGVVDTLNLNVGSAHDGTSVAFEVRGNYKGKLGAVVVDNGI
jgi:hypothetical protein